MRQLHRRGTWRHGAQVGAQSLAAAAVSRSAAAPAIAKDIKVCLIAGKTGALEAYAKQTENGFMMGLEYLTKGTMKVGDDKLEIIVKDDQLKPDRGKSLLEECYSDDKADIAVGTTGSPIALAMLPVAEEKQEGPDRRAGGGRLDHRRQVEPLHLPHRPQLLPGRAGRRRRHSRKAATSSIGMLGLDTAFGRDGVAAFKAGAGRHCGRTSRSSPRNTRPATRPTSRRSPSACSTRSRTSPARRSSASSGPARIRWPSSST